jgi:hypothetical protein
MNKKTLIFMGLMIGLMGILLLFNNPTNNYQEQLTALETELVELKEEKIELKQKLDNETTTNQGLKDELIQLNKTLEQLIAQESYSISLNETYFNKLQEQVKLLTSSANPKSLLAVYTGDINTYEPTLLYYLSEEKNTSTLENVKLIAEVLSSEQFEHLKIEVLEIDDDNILHINLAEPTILTDNTKTWQSGFFQGSTGGMITSVTLIESFLQRHLETNDWISGVVFSYEGEQNYLSDHVEFLFEAVHRR